jgi:dihydroflavonol-4-reductase
MYRSNVDGTRSLLNAAQKAGVERCVYTSTVGCIGMPKGELGSEETPASLEEMQGPYKRSKYQAEQVALQFAAEGFPVVIVNPTAPVGDHDFRPTPTGKIVVDFLRGAMPAYLDTGLNVVYVGDVAAGHLLACARTRREALYSGWREPDAPADLWQVGRGDGKPAPKMRIPYAVAYAAEWPLPAGPQ